VESNKSQQRCRCLSVAAVIGVLIAASTVIDRAHAQVATSINPDGTLGTTVAPAGASPLGGAAFEINGGTIKGSNQFHSFDRFSVGTGDAALFNGPAGIQNILSRVTGQLTGPAPSQIDGYLASLIPGANVFLMNPAGILFGPNAQLDVSGAFHATTANYIAFADGTRFNAMPSGADALLTSAAPAAFGFLTSNPAAIEVDTSSIVAGAFGQPLSFVGGPVNVGAADFSAPAYLMAPAGRLNLVSVASPGEATFDGTGFNVDGFAQLGPIRIQGGSIVDGKEVFIRGGQLAIDEAVILPGGFSFFGLGPAPDGGEVNIKVTGDVTITGTAPEPFTTAPPGILVFNGAFDSIAPAAKVPDITINAGSLSLSGFASVQGERAGPGDPGNIVINANSVTVANGAGIALLNAFEGPGGQLTINAQQVNLAGGGVPGDAVGATGLLAQGLFHPAYTSGASVDPALTLADSGTITVNASQSLTMSGGAQITTDSRSFGRSDDITINTGDMLLSDRGSIIAAQSLFSGNSGNVNIAATGQVTINNGFVIAANTYGSGDSGNVNISAGKGLTISGTASGIASQTGSPPQAELDAFAQLMFLDPTATFTDLVLALGLDPATATILDTLGPLADYGLVPALKTTPGNAGTITVTAPTVIVSGQNSAIDSGTAWGAVVDGTVYGNAGPVQVNATNVTVSGGGEIRSRSGILNLNTGNLDVGSGNAGTVTVAASGALTVTGANSAISTSTLGDGAAGDVTLSANQVNVQNGGRVSSESGGLVGGTGYVGTGAGGDVSIAGNAVTVAGTGSAVSTSTFGDGAGGDVTLNANQVNVQDGGHVTSESGGQLGGALTAGSGAGGVVTITASNAVNISGQDAVVSTSTFGNGNGGNVALNAGNSVQISNGGLVSADSLALVGAGTGLAGNINVTSGDSITMESGTISTRAVTSDGGDVKLSAPGTIYLNNSQITTSVESGVGGGGNIGIDPQFVILNNSSVIANAYGGPGGNITIVADNFLQSTSSVIEASSALSTPGTIRIVSPENNVESSIQQLASEFLDASSLLRGLCSARRTGAASSFTVASRGGVPVDADSYLPSFGMGGAAGTASAGAPVIANSRDGGERIALALVMPNTLDCTR
jgi:filamentous hemagglutinin family protein